MAMWGSLVITLCSVPCVLAQNSVNTKLALFDKVVTKSLIAQGFSGPQAFHFRRSQEADRRTYESICVLPLSKADQHYVIAITAAPSGKLLDAAEYEKRRGAFLASDTEESRRVLDRDFPNIGLRALRHQGSFGPGGASYSLLLTTSDGRFDIRIAVSNLLSGTIPDPGFDSTKIARLIACRYDGVTRSPVLK